MRRTTAPTFNHQNKAPTALLSLCLALGLTCTATTGIAGPVVLLPTLPDAAPTAPLIAAGDDTVSLLAGLISIERDLLLGQLFLQDGLVNAEGSHFHDPRRETLPAIRDGLAKAGAPDLEPLLIALEEASGKDAVMAAYVGVLSGLQQSKSALKASEQDMMQAIIVTTEAAAGLLDPSGVSGVEAYQEAWGLLMAARGQLDGLTGSSDPAIRKTAAGMALAFDDVILFAPDPVAKAPVAFDPALILQLVVTLNGQVLSI